MGGKNDTLGAKQTHNATVMLCLQKKDVKVCQERKQKKKSVCVFKRRGRGRENGEGEI